MNKNRQCNLWYTLHGPYCITLPNAQLKCHMISEKKSFKLCQKLRFFYHNMCSQSREISLIIQQDNFNRVRSNRQPKTTFWILMPTLSAKNNEEKLWLQIR